MPGGDVLDPDVLNSLRQLTPAGEPDVLVEILTVFLNDVPKRIVALRAAAAAGDAIAMQRAAHSLKGSSGNIGARALHDVCRQLNDHARSGDLTRMTPLLDSLAIEYDRVEVEIRRLLQSS